MLTHCGRSHGYVNPTRHFQWHLSCLRNSHCGHLFDVIEGMATQHNNDNIGLTPMAGISTGTTTFGVPIAGIPMAGTSSGTSAAFGSHFSETLITGYSTCTSVLNDRPGTNDSATNVWPEDLMELVKRVLDMPIRKPKKPKFAFELTMEAAERNYLLLT